MPGAGQKGWPPTGSSQRPYTYLDAQGRPQEGKTQWEDRPSRGQRLTAYVDPVNGTQAIAPAGDELTPGTVIVEAFLYVASLATALWAINFVLATT